MTSSNKVKGFAAGVVAAVCVRRGGDAQGSGNKFHFAAASFSFAAASRSSRFAVRKLCTSGMPAGQP